MSTPSTVGLRLPDPQDPGGGLVDYTPGPAPDIPVPAHPARSRHCYAAVHVVADPLAPAAPGGPARLDWEATLAVRHRLWDLGLGVADAMDTAQRGMGLDWPATRELIRRSGAEARARGADLVCGAGTDHLDTPGAASLQEVARAYLHQVETVADAGARPVIMASRALAAVARGPADYLEVYDEVLRQVDAPVMLHWLGSAFDPALAGYWGHDDPAEAVGTVAALLRDHASRVMGIKVSLLDSALEVRLRREVPAGVAVYTGDDFNYPELIHGDEQGYSHALLGIFTAIAPVAAAAVHALDRDDAAGYHRLLAPTVPLARHLFAEPTYHYKTGIAFLSWLNGHQPGFTMVGGMQSARGMDHLAAAFRLAEDAGVLADPPAAARRMRTLLEVSGVAR